MIAAPVSADFSTEAFTEEQFVQRSCAKVNWKILPALMICRALVLLGHSVIGFAKRGLTAELDLSDTAYDAGALFRLHLF